MTAMELKREYKAGRLLPLPVPIGDKVYVPFCEQEVDGSPYEGVEETYLCGYINERGRIFYVTYCEDGGSCDVAPEDLCITEKQARLRLDELRKEKANEQN